MNVAIYYLNRMPHQLNAAERFAAGLKRHGIKADILPANQIDGWRDLAVFWGHRQNQIIARQKSAGRPYLVMERGYMGDRFYWTSLGFNGLNGRATFPKIDDGFERWHRYFAWMLEYWKVPKPGGVCLIMGQVMGDASLDHCRDFKNWVQDIRLRAQLEGFTVRFRPHPLSREAKGVHLPPIARDLAETDIVATFNSNSGVDAIMAGVPAYAEDEGSMIYGLCGFPPKIVERYEWMKKMAYTQWTPEEIENGDAYSALKTVLTV